MQYTLNQLTVLILSNVLSSNLLEKNKEHHHDSFNFPPILNLGFTGSSVVKNLPAMQETKIWSVSQEDPLEKGMASHSSILAGKIPCTEKLGGLQSTGSQRVRHDWRDYARARTHTHTHTHRTILNLLTFPSILSCFLPVSVDTGVSQDSWLFKPKPFPVNPKGNQPWMSIGRTNAEAEAPLLWPPDARADSLEKTLTLGKIEGRGRRGWQRMRWLDGITDSVDINLSKLLDIVKDREA